MFLTKGTTACEEDFIADKEEIFKAIDNLAPKAC